MKKIGFVDFYLDEWHANHYPDWIRNSRLGADFRIGGAWELQAGARPLATWCREMEIPPYHSLEALIADCDAFCVLAPSNPERHEELAHEVLASGKPVFIDKPFAPDQAAAERLFQRADQFHTPLFSSSALRFSNELQAARNQFPVDFMETQGGGSSFWEYSIHQIEMLVSVMGGEMAELSHVRYGDADHVEFAFADGRGAAMTLHPKLGFSATLLGRDHGLTITRMTDMFPNLIDAMLKFFRDGIPPVDRRETIAIARIIRTAIDAAKTPGVRRKL